MEQGRVMFSSEDESAVGYTVSVALIYCARESMSASPSVTTDRTGMGEVSAEDGGRVRGGGAMSSGGAVVSGGRVVIASGGAVISVSGGLTRQPAVQSSRPHSRSAQPKSRPYRGLICFMSDPF